MFVKGSHNGILLFQPSVEHFDNAIGKAGEQNGGRASFGGDRRDRTVSVGF